MKLRQLLGVWCPVIRKDLTPIATYMLAFRVFFQTLTDFPLFE